LEFSLCVSAQDNRRLGGVGVDLVVSSS